jgi:integrase
LVWAETEHLRSYLFSTVPNAGNRNDIRAALCGFGEFVVAQCWRPDNPAIGLPRLPTPRAIPRALTVEQAHTIDLVAPTYGAMAAALVRLLLYTGLRKSEARMLRWSDVEGGWVRVMGKGSKERIVPLPPPAAEAMAAWRLESTSAEYVFVSPRRPSEPISSTTFANLIRDVGCSAGIEGLTPHALRHTLATQLLAIGGDLRQVQEWLGHASPATTAIYTRVRPSDLRRVAQRVHY